MFKRIRTSKFSKFMVYYLSLMLFIEMTQPMRAYALTEGPSQPEFNSFTPIGTSDMVDLASGDFNYNIPIMDVGGYPINLAYNSGVTMDQEASWVGLGWNLNIGQINRNVRGLPDDFNGDQIETKNNIRNNITVGVQGYVNPQIIGVKDVTPSAPSPFSAGLNLQYNNYHGISAVPSFGLSFKISENVSVGMQISSSNQEGASISPSVSLSAKSKDQVIGDQFCASLSPSLTYNSRQGLSSFNINAGIQYINKSGYSGKDASYIGTSKNTSSGSGSISFLNNTFTPSKRLGLKNDNVTFSFSGGPDVWGGHVEASIAASASVQKLIEKIKFDKAYGYENTDNATEFDLLDFNREKEQTTVTNNTLVLPVTNYTYDILSIQGQGLSGTIRPYRGQIGYVYEPKVSDISASTSIGVEVEGGAGFHGGANIKRTNTNSYTSNWNTVVTPFLKEKKTGNALNYEKVYYKNTGENRIDTEYSTMFSNKLGGYSPIMLKLDLNKDAINQYFSKTVSDATVGLSQVNTAMGSGIKRNQRELRNQVIQKITFLERTRYGLENLITANTNSKQHHTAGYIITDENSSRHIYGATAYNTEKQEVTYATGQVGNISNGLVPCYSWEDSMGNSQGIDHYYNNVKTPAYAHTYLLTSILSPDYEDLTLNGVSDDDLGSYTKFEYTTNSNYKWRVPFKGASYNEGLKTDKRDQKASYLYGEKELKYVTKIVTKTHIAFIDLVDRQDGLGVESQNGGNYNNSGPKMQRIATIRLYSKPEITVNGVINDPGVNGVIKPIKTAHFEYDYSLCPGIDNSTNVNNTSNNGKLTLKKVYFTYRDSNMGKYTPYKFNYSEDANFDYNPKNYDIWGNFKKNLATESNQAITTTPQEFPYVDQDNDAVQNRNASAWSLTSIDLPSGGKIELTYESDDYQYVQNMKAMQMFKVAGVASENLTIDTTGKLYGSLTGEAKYVAVKINDEDNSLPDQTIIDKYTGGLKGKAIYFNFFLNMANGDKDYVSGYFEMNRDAKVQVDGAVKYILIPMKHINKEGKFNNNDTRNPISVAGWFFGRQNLQYQLYNDTFDPGQTNVVTIARSILSNLGAMLEIFRGPNGRLSDKGVAKYFTPQKSWIRLMEPSGSKLGGGSRVKKVIMKDNWEKMMQIDDNSADIDRYKKQYGQEYDYTLEGGTSSGVATYEPNVCKENPLVQPFYHNAEKMAARTYQEKPFGESFFPTPTVTYRKVTVKNITAADVDNENETIRKTRSGKVTTEFYTSYDFPTKTDFTSLKNPIDNPIASKYYTNENEAIKNMIKGMLGLKVDVKTDLTMSQGFVVETNDMNGKMKKQIVQNNAGDEISSVEYIYHTVEDDPSTPINENDPTTLKSELTVINKDGTITNDHALGMHYDVINDLRESYSETNVAGIGINVDVIPIGIFPIVIGMGIPERSTHKQILRTAVTTKVINKTAILKEKIAYDLGSRVSTKNLAWDAQTGQVLLTQTQNEFDDSYYTLNYPGYWHYDDMGMASVNSDITGKLEKSTSNPNQFSMIGITASNPISNYLKLGDELVTYRRSISFNPWPPKWSTNQKKLWVSGYNATKTAVTLIDENGQNYSIPDPPIQFAVLNRLLFRVIRSGYRNQQMASMASITLMKNPLSLNANGEGFLNQDLIRFNTIADPITEDPKIINASAIEYSQDWASQCENGLPSSTSTNFNKYLYNVLGEWRPVKSYAYLTGRNATTNSNTRNSGYYKKFNPFYKRENNNWVIDNTNWTFASSVTMYNPYGVELENRDALNRYSAAQYGYQYKLPVAVGSNARYQEIGFDGFEDYNPLNYTTPSTLKPHFGFSQGVGTTTAEVKSNTSHTGKNSIMVKPTKKVAFTRKINGCKEDTDSIPNNQMN